MALNGIGNKATSKDACQNQVFQFNCLLGMVLTSTWASTYLLQLIVASVSAIESSCAHSMGDMSTLTRHTSKPVHDGLIKVTGNASSYIPRVPAPQDPLMFGLDGQETKSLMEQSYVSVRIQGNFLLWRVWML
jgi:hypothetical protein